MKYFPLLKKHDEVEAKEHEKLKIQLQSQAH